MLVKYIIHSFKFFDRCIMEYFHYSKNLKIKKNYYGLNYWRKKYRINQPEYIKLNLMDLTKSLSLIG